MNAAMARNVALDLGPNLRLFANQYIILMGPAGCRKSKAIDDASWLIAHKACGLINIAPDVMTKEAFMRLFADNKIVKPPGWDLRLDRTRSAVFLVNDEIVTFFKRRHNDELLDWLTKLYDTQKPVWSYATIARGVETIVGTCLNILGGITPSSFADSMPAWALSSGWARRLLVVYEQEPAKLISISDSFDEERYHRERDELARYLGSVTRVEGVLEKTDGFKRLFDTIRVQNQSIVSSHGHMFNERLQGYYSGRPTLIAKTAMSMSLASSLEMTITEEHLQEAYKEFLLVEQEMERAYERVGLNPLRATEATIIDCLRLNGTVPEKALLSLVAPNATNREAAAAIGDLCALGRIIVELPKGKKGQRRYRLA